MKCPKCGTENPEGAQLCRSCSAVLTSTSTQAPSAGAKTSGLAITSLVLAILSPCTCFITAIPAIILGIIALVKIARSAGSLKGNGLAIAGIALPVVLLPFIALLMGIMMPALARARQIAFRQVCGTNLRQIGIVMTMYAEENNQYPAADRWCDLLLEHAEITKNSLRCPSAPEGPCNYAMNKNIEKLDLNNAPPDMVLLFETSPGWNQSGGPEILTTENHQDDGCNILFADGRVEFVKRKNLKDLKW